MRNYTLKQREPGHVYSPGATHCLECPGDWLPVEGQKSSELALEHSCSLKQEGSPKYFGSVKSGSATKGCWRNMFQRLHQMIQMKELTSENVKKRGGDDKKSN